MSLRRVHLPTALLLALAVVVASAVVAPASAQAADFEDTRGRPYAEAVSALAERSIVFGCEPARYCPSDTLTRAQLAAVLSRAFELPVTDDAPFGDTSGHEHEVHIDALAAAGITQGCDDSGNFCPNQPISREHVATMLVRAFDVSSTSARHFNDVSPGGTHTPSVHALAETGISAGCTVPLDGYCPHQTVTRAQAAFFVARALELVDRVELVPLAERERQEAARLAEIAAREQAAREARQRADREAIWDRLAQCESGGNWAINTGNGYYGGLQFSLSSWRAVGGSGYPHQSTRAEQINRGERLQSLQGWGAWPACSRKLGLR